MSEIEQTADHAVQLLDARVFVAIVDVIATAVCPGIRTPRGYALRHEITARLADVDAHALIDSLERLEVAEKIGHYYDRDGLRIYCKGTR